MQQRSFRPVPHHGGVGAAGGSQPAQAINRLEQIRLALSVSTRYEIQPWSKLDRLSAEVSKVLQLNLPDPQDAYDNLTGISK
jgi:hypothetical protein